MSLLDLGADDVLAAAPRFLPQAQLPPKTSLWQDINAIGTAPSRAIHQAAAEVLATGFELAAGLRYQGNQKQTDAQGYPREAFQSDFADALRERGREFRPDPQTATAAEQIIYGFARGAAKIIPATMAAGPVGAIAAGAEEMNTVSAEMKAAGIDPATRDKAAAVQGAGLALAALPLAGQTVASTAALYLAGGPGGFMAQQALTRQILKDGGYQQQAEAYDPLDPVGLAVSALIPAPFAVHGYRANKIAAAVRSLPDIPREAAPEPRAPEPFPSELTPVAQAVRSYDAETVDAARVALLMERRAASNPDPVSARAADQHEAALSKAEEQMARGEPVQVADVAPPAATAMQFSERLDAAIAERGYTVTTGDRSQATGGPGARNIVIADMPEAEFMAAHGNPVEDVKAHEFAHAYWAGATGLPNFRDPANKPLLAELRQASQEFRPYVWQTQKAHANKPDELLADGMAFWMKNPDRRADYPQIDKLMRSYDAGGLVRQFPDSPLPRFAEDLRAAAAEVEAARAPEPKAEPAPPAAAVATEPAAAPPAAKPTEGAAKPEVAEAATLQPRVDSALAQFPDLMVQLDGMDAPMRAADLLERVKREADAEKADAPDLMDAAQCAILNGQ